MALKKLTVLAVACLLVLGVALAAHADRPYEGVEITILALTEHESYVMGDEDLLAPFEEMTGMTVNIEYLWHERLWDRLKLEGLARTAGLTAFRMSPIYLAELVPIGAVEPLDKYIEMFGYEEQMKDWPDSVLFSHGRFPGMDELWAMPINANVPVILYRKDLFYDPVEQAAFLEQYGYELRPPQTTDELLDAAEFFTRDTTGDGVIDLYGYEELMGPGAHARFGVLGWIWTWGEDLFGENYAVTLDTPGVVEVMTWLDQLLQYAPRDIYVVDYAEELSWISAGSVAMAKVWAGNARAYLNPEEHPGNFERYGITLIPRKEGSPWEAGRGVLGGGGLALWAHDSEIAKEAAAYFIFNWLFDEAQHEAYMRAGAFHPRAMTFEHPLVEEDPLLSVLGPIWLEALAKSGHARPMIPEAAVVYDELDLMSHRVLLDGVDPAVAVAESAEEIHSIMEEAGYY